MSTTTPTVHDTTHRMKIHPRADAIADRARLVLRWWESLPQRGPVNSLDLDITTILLRQAHADASSLATDIRHHESGYEVVHSDRERLMREVAEWKRREVEIRDAVGCATVDAALRLARKSLDIPKSQEPIQ